MLLIDSAAVLSMVLLTRGTPLKGPPLYAAPGLVIRLLHALRGAIR